MPTLDYKYLKGLAYKIEERKERVALLKRVIRRDTERLEYYVAMILRKRRMRPNNRNRLVRLVRRNNYNNNDNFNRSLYR